MACEEHRNPLQRSGMSQADRRLPGLSPGYVGIDERSYGDWIVFAAELSKWLRFYDSRSGESVRDWQVFFTGDVSAVLAAFAVQSIDTWRVELRKRLDFLRDHHNSGDDAALRRALGEAISAVVTLAKALDDFYAKLTDEVPFKLTIRRLIRARLGSAFRRHLGYFKAARSLGLYAAAENPDWTILDRPLTPAEDFAFDSSGFSPEWWAAGVRSLAEIPADESVFGAPGSVYARLSHAARHFLFSSVFDQFTEAYSRLIADAEVALAETLEQDGHRPHWALFLSFLRLFRVQQAQVNGLLWRHLDFYYKDVLRLRLKGAEPDHVHLVAELAKSVSAASLPEGTLFKAGKDSTGNEVFYALDRETTFNKAEVAALQAVYRVDPTDTWKDPVLASSRRVFAAPVMNSADGLGAELLSSSGEWHPFLNKAVAVDGAITAVRMPPARIGFALASHYLFLAEGARTIQLRFGGDGFGTFPKEKLVCLLTHEKGWLEKTPQAIRGATFSDGDPCTEIEILLPGTDPGLVAWNAKVHGGAFGVDVPVIQLVLRNEPGEVYGFDDLKNVLIRTAEIHVRVGAASKVYDSSGAKQLLVSNASGALDPSKPFLPWGPVPVCDAPLVIGSRELFSKRHAQFNLHIEWANRPARFSPSSGALLEFLQGGQWQGTDRSQNVCSAASQRTFSFEVPIPDASLIDYRDSYPGLIPASRAGFMRLVLTGDFGQEAFADVRLEAVLDAARDRGAVSAAADGTANGRLEEFRKGKGANSRLAAALGALAESGPYLPLVRAIYLSYGASTEPVNLGSLEVPSQRRAVRFFHLGPFGEAELGQPVAAASGHFLLPQLRLSGGADHIGEWRIGLRNLAPGQSVNLLFQLLEGSASPTLSKPQKHVTWSYWAGERWVAFEDRQVSDGTRQLIQSGIVRFAIPQDASTDRGILPHGFVWVMASVTEAVGAACKVLSVRAQALRATLSADSMSRIAADFLDRPRPAGTIAKLRNADARFKKFEQPYASFAGRPTESAERFYLRSSERLRHKGRAATLWDYEALVLEAFPTLYKVKCLNHTRIEDNPDASLAIYSENSPGHVSLVAIPRLLPGGSDNPLKPFASAALLDGIREYLGERVTGQLNLHVCNPLFEEIFLEFALQLRAGFDDFTWYSELLREEITRHLSPWAFAPIQGGARELQFGGGISKSALVNFIEERPYVDFITSVVLKHKPGNQSVSGDAEEIVATTSRSVLVSAPSTEHTITRHGT